MSDSRCTYMYNIIRRAGLQPGDWRLSKKLAMVSQLFVCVAGSNSAAPGLSRSRGGEATTSQGASRWTWRPRVWWAQDSESDHASGDIRGRLLPRACSS